MNNTKHFNTIIIGAGISGISLAQKLSQSNIDHGLFEPNKIGGCIDSQKYKDFWLEMGAHTIYNSYNETIDYIRNNSLKQNIQPRRKAPFLFVQPNNKIQSIFTNINPFVAAFSFLKNRNISKEDKTVSEYAIKLFGKKNYDKTLKFCFDAVLSQNSQNFPVEYLFKKYDRDISLPRSFTFKNGLSELFTNQKQTVIKEKIIKISKQDTWIVETDNANSYHCDNLCIATPWNITESLLKDILPNIAKHQYRPIMSILTSIGIVANKKSLKHIKNIAGLIGKDQFFYSAVSRDVVDNPSYRAIVFHCKDNYSQKELMHKITKLLNITEEDILHTYIKQNTLPCYHRNHHIFLQDLEKELLEIPNLYITGNFFDRLAIENCIRRSSKEASRLIKSP
ncbi:NAD(P)-binding protein [Francisella noatunensis]|uniref:NAD(P)-binding protein n=1 Tax=Francisella noatunensis TaxID=657445 RepID=A0A9Q2QE31_9GAMM|nr:NAD(P)-binding protein [Francisella noatunensis]MBK2028436.1 NAD(P)-binding protein [Francisella noatunensis]MBK2033849.1 NAD(P)-binding protein [Francisella noatunensis]MBK2049353.1 NAD(P)-binding protein [Francisella noatunensis]MBK2050802.1 NAD(P)-binding protein [Francisella noatunensis]MBK2052078.1 NAD(P)-binding protein [Francisella noatunensis]